MKNKILMLMVLGIFLLSLTSVSALDFDNLKTYNPTTKEVTLTNSILGIPFLPTGDIAKIQLLTPLNVKVARGYQKVAEFKVTGYLDYDNLLKRMEFYNIKNKMREETRTFDLKKKVVKKVLVNDYKEICTLSEEKTENSTENKICKNTIVGSHYEDRVYWEDLTQLDLRKGSTLIVGVFTNVKKGDRIEWVPTFAGVKVTEWATWTEDLDTGLVAYYKLDETSGTTAVDELGNNDGTINGATVGQAGKINYAYDFDGSNDYVSLGNNFKYSEFSWSLWVKSDGNTGDKHIIGADRADYHDDVALQITDNTYKVIFHKASTSTAYSISGTVSDATNWNYIAVVVNSSGTYLYLNGNLADHTSTIFDLSPNTDDFRLGSQNDNADYFNGLIDEVGIWNRSLTQSEIIDLYNGGNGLEYGSYASSGLEITLNSPEDNYKTSSTSITFNVTVTDNLKVENVSLLIDGSIDQTNTSQYNGTYIFTKTLSEGSHNWSILAYDNESNNATSSTRSITVDLTAPTQTINSPTTDLLVFSLPKIVTLNVTAQDNIALSSCWYHTSDNATNITYTCNTETNISFSTGGYKTIYVYANDTAGNENSTSTTFLLNSISIDKTYESPVLEGSPTILYMNLTATEINSFNGTLYWNGTAYNATASDNGTYATLTTGLNIPSISSPQNISLYWNYNLNGINYNSSTYYQIITYLTPIEIATSCSDKALRFDIQDEENLTSLYGDVNYNFKFGIPTNPTLKEVYGTLTNVTTFYLCINATASQNYTVGYGELQYSDQNHVNRRYYLFENQTISNNTLTNHSLRDLSTSKQTSFSLTFEDTSLNKYTNKYTALWRWYPNLNEYQIVEMGKTDENGETVAHINTEDTDYRVGLYEKDGTLIKLGDPIRFICSSAPCTFTLRVDSKETDYTSFFGVETSLTYNETSKVFNLVYNDPTQKTSKMNFVVTRETGSSSLTICNLTSSGYSGAMSCNISGYTGMFKAVAYRSASPATVIAQKIINTTNTAFKTGLGLFISIILWLAIILTGLIGSPIFTIVLAIIALIPALITGSISLTIFTGIAVIGAIVIHFIKRASYR